MRNQHQAMLIRSLTLAMLAALPSANALSQAIPAPAPGAPSSAVLVELFTSEGCSDCPPADELLRQINGRKTAGGQLIVGISEHVSYWNGLGWKDPFSAELYTNRQNEYGTRLGLESVYTPQMIVNGRKSSSAAMAAPCNPRLRRSQSANRSRCESTLGRSRTTA